METEFQKRKKHRRRRARHNRTLTAISVKDLFGQLSYNNINLNPTNSSEHPISVLFGDNGAGKSTILNLIYACLSPEPNAGLRNFIAKTPFRNFCLTFSDGSQINVYKINDLRGPYRFIVDSDQFSINEDVLTNEEYSVSAQPSVDSIERSLRNFGIDILFVDHERYIKSTYQFLQDLNDEDNADILILEDSWIPTFEGRRRRKSQPRQFPILGMVEALNRKFRSEAFHQGNTSEEGNSNTYLEIVKSMVKRKSRLKPSPNIESISLDQNLEQLEIDTTSYVKHGLLPNYPFQDLKNIYMNSSRNKKKSIEDVLSPFITSVNRRISALSPIHDIITSFETELNKYLFNKRADVHILRGLTFRNEHDVLDIPLLSSGEKQLVFLLSAAVVSRDTRSLILIDEPELSLSYKWQRLFTNSLSKLSSSYNTQFLMATHSIEIISRQGDNSIELVND